MPSPTIEAAAESMASAIHQWQKTKKPFDAPSPTTAQRLAHKEAETSLLVALENYFRANPRSLVNPRAPRVGRYRVGPFANY